MHLYTTVAVCSNLIYLGIQAFHKSLSKHTTGHEKDFAGLEWLSRPPKNRYFWVCAKKRELVLLFFLFLLLRLCRTWNEAVPNHLADESQAR